VRAAIAALPGAAAERHFDALAKAVAAGTDSLPAHLKPAYIRAALAIVGSAPRPADLRKLVEYYDGLLREIEFSVRVDGDTTVGPWPALRCLLYRAPHRRARARERRRVSANTCATSRRIRTITIPTASRQSTTATSWKSKSAKS
jgi:hypothetical protein